MSTSWNVVSSSASIMCLGIYLTISFTISSTPPMSPPTAATAVVTIATSTSDAPPAWRATTIAPVLMRVQPILRDVAVCRLCHVNHVPEETSRRILASDRTLIATESSPRPSTTNDKNLDGYGDGFDDIWDERSDLLHALLSEEELISEGLSESNQLSCTLRLVLRGNGLAPGGSPAWKKLESRAVAPPTAKLAPCRKLPLCDRYGGTNGRPRFRATN
uniref:Uncharacterized protein n=1 Tax=Oryza punctata TaxID=4537 RepID=A0A0E0JFR3_ORYPU